MRQTPIKTLAVTYQQILDWFIEEHSITIEPYLILCLHNSVEIEQDILDMEYTFKIIVKGIPQFVSKDHFNYSSYYKAFDVAIEEAFKLISK